ncbi:RagB/SusD family nutrient uptake outer membrane protein [Ilyomonas limi]|uniref:RagB/SusD family nutrient uptake outer membrane protein n=1 Tax=Ilyomonas limi TaxID=2575867 RepID=A0A4U3L505_9BACT|nr:RagB/SusD family nutrient uptake outer membrane protein [Ilyomonas limi]TKK70228.1 RagB/SusD family nutrient uptake outer membrane protein [Ilyomonas limi]
MKKIFSITTVLLLCIGVWSCKKDDSEFLNVQPTAFLTTDQVFSDPSLALSVLADLYNRQADFSSLDNGWASFADFSESFPSENGSTYIVQRTGWPFDTWGLNWYDSYTYIREINLFLARDSASTAFGENLKKRFYAEGRFLRAAFYFEMVKRYGGVPLVTSTLDYDYKGDVSSLQLPRAKESDIYDFVISECEAIKNDFVDETSGILLPTSVKSRATKGAALAMEARAALYAGSIAKYGALRTPAVSLPGGEVGIDASKATGYYTIALRAAEEIISGQAGAYSLYNIGGNLSDNFAALFLDKTSPETIYMEDFKVGGRTHAFTTNDQPYSLSEEGGDAGRLDPSLNLAEQYEKLDNTYAPFATTDASGKRIVYDNQLDIFDGRDARLAGTILLPGGTFKGGTVDISAGTYLPDGTTNSTGVGKDGPVNGLEFRTQTGFYIRKYLDPTVGAGKRGTGSAVAFIRYRYAEVLLNAAEAAFELGQPDKAAMYMNQVRARAGLTIPLTPAQITFDRIVHERRVELAFEGHYFYDMKRWRLAHIVWNGTPTTLSDLKSNIGSATQHSTQPWGLWPYRYNGTSQWVYIETKPSLVTGSNRFQFGNYYTAIGSDVIGANPKIVRQPNQ